MVEEELAHPPPVLEAAEPSPGPQDEDPGTPALDEYQQAPDDSTPEEEHAFEQEARRQVPEPGPDQPRPSDAVLDNPRFQDTEENLGHRPVSARNWKLAKTHPRRETFTQRLRALGDMLANGITPSEVVRFACDRWHVAPYYARTYVSRAREWMELALGVPRRQRFALSLSGWQKLKQESLRTGDLRTYGYALARLDFLLGNDRDAERGAFATEADGEKPFLNVHKEIEAEKARREAEFERVLDALEAQRAEEAKAPSSIPALPESPAETKKTGE